MNGGETERAEWFRKETSGSGENEVFGKHRGSGKERGVSEGTERFRKEPSGGAGGGGCLCPAGTGLGHHKNAQIEAKSDKMSAQGGGRGVSAPFSGTAVSLGLRESSFCGSVMGTGQAQSSSFVRLTLYRYVFDICIMHRHIYIYIIYIQICR